MMQRVFGVLAALAMVGTTAACSSSTTTTTTTTKTDSGVDTGKADTGTVADTGTPDTDVPTDQTVGKPCANPEDCDVTGNGIAHCTGVATDLMYPFGPLSPTPICMFWDQAADACDPGALDANGEQTQIVPCDHGLGICTKSAGNNAECQGFCQFDDKGVMSQKCQGKNGCDYYASYTDSTSMKPVFLGTCGGGCNTDADCGTGNHCDPIAKYCTNIACDPAAADPNAACKAKWATAPASWQCNATSKFCEFTFPKKVGDLCDPNATDDECYCLAYKTQTQGVCSMACTVGAAGTCPTGYSCDFGFDGKDATGKQILDPAFVQPAGLNAYCMPNCTADTDCKAGWTCRLSAGMGTQKTCQPVPPA